MAGRRGQVAWAVVIAGTALSVISGTAGASAASAGTVPAAAQASARLAGYSPGADAQDMAKEVFASFCAEDPDGELHTPEWLAAVDSWQAVTPYYLRGSISPSAVARDEMFGEPRLTEDTRKATCDSMTSFAKHLKDATLDLKLELRSGCATAQGLSAFYDYKLEVFRAIDDHNWPKVTKLMPGWRNPAQYPNDITRTTCTQFTGVADTTP
jgi:hypothetical protein